MNKPSGPAILKLLEQQYGQRIWQPSFDPLGELVLTILSQNTSDKNSRPAFQSRKKAFPDWSRVLQADIGAIAGPITSGGLATIKAQRIKSALGEIQRKRGSLDLLFLSDLPFEEAREWLVALPGVGFKTASCVLCFALGRPAMPVDTHVFRVATRLGLIPLKTRVDNAHLLLEKAVPSKDIYEFHVLLIEHGRRTCAARRPTCVSCICKSICTGYDKYSTQI